MMDAHDRKDRAGTLLPPGTPLAFHLLAKPTGAICNLDCTYCFFLSKEMLYPGSRFRMADDLLELYLRQLIQAHAGSPEVVVAWQGGEPTMMGLDFLQRSVQLAEALKQPGQRIVHTIQTNGTLLDDAWAAFFAGHGFLVGLSIDGPLEVCVRAAQAGNGKSATASQAATASPGQDFGNVTRGLYSVPFRVTVKALAVPEDVRS